MLLQHQIFAFSSLEKVFFISFAQTKSALLNGQKTAGTQLLVLFSEDFSRNRHCTIGRLFMYLSFRPDLPFQRTSPLFRRISLQSLSGHQSRPMEEI